MALNQSKNITAYIVMKGHDYEGLCNNEEAYLVYFDKKEAEEIANKFLGEKGAYNDIIQISIPLIIL